jgi:hypothetical protein
MKGEIRMSEARKCDRCSSYFEYDENMNNYIVFGNRHIIVDLKRGKDFDICPKCMKEFEDWFFPSEEETDCADRSNGATEKELELASKLNNAKFYIAQLKNELGYAMTKEEIELMKGIHNFTDEDISEAAKFVETRSSSEEEYKDPCTSCHDCHCEQCDYGYISEEEKKKRWVERHKTEVKLSDPYEDGGL